MVRLIPAPRGTGIVSAPVPKKLLKMAGVEDCYTSATGSTGTLGNFGKLYSFGGVLYLFVSIGCKISFYLPAKATYQAIAKTYAYLTPDLWKDTQLTSSPIQEHTDYLTKNHRPVVGPRNPAS